MLVKGGSEYVFNMNNFCSLQRNMTQTSYFLTDGCDALDNLNGGSVSMTTDGSETQAIFSCGTGYSMNGGSVLTCRSDGSWDVSPPSCSRWLLY